MRVKDLGGEPSLPHQASQKEEEGAAPDPGRRGSRGGRRRRRERGVRGDGGRGVRGDRGGGVWLLFLGKKFAECCRSSTRQRFFYFFLLLFFKKRFYISLPSVADLALGKYFFIFFLLLLF